MGARTAVLVVHGVADQAAGDTARSVVDLLVSASPANTCYAVVGTQALTLPVPPLEPLADARLMSGNGNGNARLGALKRSCRSDLARAAGSDDVDPEITVTDALVRKHAEVNPGVEIYATTLIEMQRRPTGQAAADRLDVFEMYWADLSRLSGSVPRIVSEVFTLIFRLARLGRDTVHELAEALARRHDPASPRWTALRALQSVLDWIFVHVLAVLTLQLGLLGGMLLGLGLLRAMPQWQMPAAGLLGAALAVACGYWLWYGRPLIGWALRTLLAGLAVAGVAAVAWRAQAAQPVLFVALVAAATACNAAFIRIAAERFNFQPEVPVLMWAVVLLAMGGSTAMQWQADPAASHAPTLAVFVRAVVFGIELVLFAMKYLWIGLGIGLALWFLAGTVAKFRGDYEAQASVTTGRLGLGAALAGFLMLTMVLWAALSQTFRLASENVAYQPCLFAVEAASFPQAAVRAVVAPPPDACVLRLASLPAAVVDASQLLESRYVNSTTAFALVAMVVLLLLIYVVAMLVPSVLAESRLLRAKARSSPQAFRLGQWLTRGYRYADPFVTGCFTVGVLLAVAVSIAFYDAALLQRLGAPDGIVPWLAEMSSKWLKPFVFSAAGLGATLILFGGFLSKRAPAIRGPLDIALDVDNHFRVFPRHAIPRARILCRYVAVLREIARRHAETPYDRLVIVAHSQGTVISADTLRYLCSDGRHAGDAARPRLDGRDDALPPVHVATFGCPLRQLYAARFPTLYRWVLATRAGISGPSAADIGAARWANAFCAGDYVGRWLWSSIPAGRPIDAREVIGHPMLDVPVEPLLGRTDAYAAFAPWPPDAPSLAAAEQFEMCVGFGAHTHYFDIDQSDSAWLIDHMIATPWSPAAPSLAPVDTFAASEVTAEA